VRIDPDGRFTFRNVPPGQYQIRARAETDPQEAALVATYRVVVNGRDLTGLELPLMPGAVVAGRIVQNGRQARTGQGFKGVRVRAPFADGSSFGDAPTGTVGADGAFRIRGLMSGLHVITVEGLEEPWVIETVTWRGEDITDLPIDVEPRQRFEDVRITLTDAASDLTGTVRDARGGPVEDALVVVVPTAAQFWHRSSRRLAVRRSDNGGRYRVRGLPPGEYRALATVDLDETEAYRRDRLAELLELGQPIRLGAPQAQALDLPLTSLVRAKRASGD
jgi:hypothetical protein